LSAAVFAGACLVVCVATARADRERRLAPPAVHPLSIVARENRRPGTTGWLGPTATGRAIEVYAGSTDAAPGETVSVHVSTVPAARYRLLVYRLGWYRGVGAREVLCLPSCSGDEQGAPQAMPAPDGDGRIAAGWPVTDTAAVARWVSGYYLFRAVLTSGAQAGASASTYVIVNRPGNRSRMLVQVPVNTWQAYNSWGGRSLYDLPTLGPRARRVSFDRPYAWYGPGGQGPLGWELPLLRFIERRGWDVSYQSDVATDARPATLLRHRLVVVAGHSEYWSRTMRDAFEAARDHGVNLAFMGANAAYYQVHMEDGGRTVMSYKSLSDPNPDALSKTAMFRELTPPRYECGLIGIQHQGVGLHWQPGDYSVVASSLGDPWMRNTGFTASTKLPGIVSVETDTIPGNQTAASSCGHALTVFFHRELGGDKDGNADATRYTAPSGATVFASGSHQFAWGLDDFALDRDEGHGHVSRPLQRFVRNAFNSMTRPNR
jgi:hypothetical protein